MAEQEHPPVGTDAAPDRMRKEGPFWLATLLSAGGLVFLLVGSVTMFLGPDEAPRRQSVRSIWLAFSRNLPDLGPDALVRAGFWVLLLLIAVLAMGLMLLASTVRDDPGPGADPPA